MSRPPAHSVCLLIASASVVLGCRVTCDAPNDCDIRSASCQRDVLEAVRCVRGGERVDVPVRVVSIYDYSESRRQMIDPEAAEGARVYFRALALLDLVARDLDVEGAVEIDIGNVGAFYDPGEREVTVLHRGEALDDIGAISTLAHEFVHAQQDIEHGFDALDERFADSYDASLAIDALTEGEATLYESQVSAYSLGFEPDDVELGGALDRYRAAARARLAQSESPWIQLETHFAYPFGTSYVSDAFDAGGRDGVAALYDSPPVSSRQVIQGFGAAPPGGEPWVEAELAELAVPRLDAFPTLLAVSQYGAYALETALRHWRRDDPPALASGTSAAATELAGGLRADRLSLLAGGDDVAIAWRLRFADEKQAERAGRAIEDGLEERGRKAAVERVDRDVLVLAASSRALDSVDVRAVAWDPVPVEEEPADEAASHSDRRLLCARR